jgi:hypothetical protein
LAVAVTIGVHQLGPALRLAPQNDQLLPKCRILRLEPRNRGTVSSDSTRSRLVALMEAVVFSVFAAVGMVAAGQKMAGA